MKILQYVGNNITYPEHAVEGPLGVQPQLLLRWETTCGSSRDNQEVMNCL
jgi:hypothetical protein